MKKAVINTGGKQYIVAKGDIIDVELLPVDTKSVKFDPLLVFEDEKTEIGMPAVKGTKVTAKIIDNTKGNKVTAIRYKAKKRVHKTKGHRQNYTRLEITSISSK